MNLNDLIPLFVQIVTEDKFRTLGPPFTYQLADDVKTNMLTKSAIEIDVKGAFPTICRLMYGKEDPFVQSIFAIPDKFERNKHIAITLKRKGDLDGKSYLTDLNLWSKILTMGYIYSRFEDIVIIQYVKDGAIFIGTHKEEFDMNCKSFVDYIHDNDVVFHERQIDTFIRFNKTSLVAYGGDVTVKGLYHDLPEYISHDIIPALLSGSIYDYTLLDKVKKIYSKLYGQISLSTPAHSDIKKFYDINGKYLNSLGKPDSLSNLDPRAYLRYIVYPILSLCRANQNNI